MSARDPATRGTPGPAMATRAQLRTMGQGYFEPEPGVAVVVRWTGERMRWLQVFGKDVFRLVEGEFGD